MRGGEMAKARNRDVPRPAFHSSPTPTPTLDAFAMLLGSVGLLRHVPLGYFKQRHRCWCAFQLSLRVGLLQGQCAWKQELASFLRLCSFLIWGLSPCLAHCSPALRKLTVQTWAHLSKPCLQRNTSLVPISHIHGRSVRNIQQLSMKVIFKS